MVSGRDFKVQSCYNLGIATVEQSSNIDICNIDIDNIIFKFREGSDFTYAVRPNYSTSNSMDLRSFLHPLSR